MRLIAYLVPLVAFTSCEKRREVFVPREKIDQEQREAEILPPEVDSFLNQMIEGTPEEARRKIKEAETAEETYDHLGAGMAFRNGELRRNDSQLRKALIRKGLHASDDMSSIILISFARRVRGEPVKFDEQISDYRQYWASSDTVAPTDISCPLCKAEMRIIHTGPPPGWDRKKDYFQGECTLGHIFWYYHRDGWQTTEQIESRFGEQGGGGQPATRSESK